MARIINVSKALVNLKIYKDTTIVIEVKDDWIPSNSARYQITNSNGVNQVECVTKEAEVSYTIAELTQQLYKVESVYINEIV